MFINIESYTEQLNSGENLADIANRPAMCNGNKTGSSNQHSERESITFICIIRNSQNHFL